MCDHKIRGADEMNNLDVIQDSIDYIEDNLKTDITAQELADRALKYGFDTYAGFYKAFVREFEYTPKQLLKEYRLNKPYRICLLKEDCNMMTHKNWGELDI